MAVKKKMYQNDLKPDYVVQLTDVDPDGTITEVDLTTATAVRVIGVLVPTGGVAEDKFDRPATSADSGGLVMMEWEVGDTDTLGLLSTEVEVMWPGDKPQTFRPPELVQILADLGGTA